ncbi:MAG TPA: hypothetical protein DCX53_09120 [Anaerolineae bacterium]|nr:hypothetical protein [Anaerolineae bacterium]
MSIPEFVPIPPINRNAIIGFISALIALISLCAVILPLPFVVILCYPPGILFGMMSIVLGLKSQRELRFDGKSGRTLAVLAVWVGCFAMLAYACALTAGVLLFPRVSEYFSQIIK